MDIEAILFVLLLVGGLLALPVVRRRSKYQVLIIGAIGAWTAVSAWSSINPRNSWVSEPQITGRPIRSAGDDFATSKTCKACHPHKYATWDASYHQSMTQVASPATILGRFPAEISFRGQRYRFTRRGDEFWVDIPDPQADWSRARKTPRIQRQILMATGSHHEQLYWYPSGQSRKLVLMPFAWHIGEEKWVPRDSVFLMPADQMQSHFVGQWNKTCIKCHSTQGNPGVDTSTLPRMDMNTHAVEFGIACESCHGPAAVHVALNGDPLRRYQYHFDSKPDESIVNPRRLSHRRASQVCGQCHGVTVVKDLDAVVDWWVQGYQYRPGDDFEQSDRYFVRYNQDLDTPGIQLLFKRFPNFMQDTFWPDGMVRVSGREYNGMLDTPCFTRGEMSCLSCHTMHKASDDGRSLDEWAEDQLKPGMRGQEACLQCHEEFRAKIEQHTHHAPESSGSNCYNCHMPNTAYGLLKATRSHMLDSPSVQVRLDTGRPNACNQCHLDKTLAWTAEYLERWYEVPQPELYADERSIASSALLALSGDAGQRALIAWSMGWEPALEASGTSWQVPFLTQLLTDPYDAVRFVAYQALRAHPGLHGFEFDHVAPPKTLLRFARQAYGSWRAHRDSEMKTGEHLLINEDGSLRQETFSRLLGQRDDRRVTYQE